MGRYQPAKVNPETKQYYVLSNFSGGINTEFADEIMQDYESRALINVDLAKAGTIQRRKGWGIDNTANEIFGEVFYHEGKPVKPLHAEIIFDKYNTMSLTKKQYDEYTGEYEVHLLVAYYFYDAIGNQELEINPGTYLYFKVTKATREIADEEFVYTVEDEALTGSYILYLGPYNLLSKVANKKFPIVTHRYNDTLYFYLGAREYVADNSIYAYNITENEIVAIKNTNSYKPIPYEITNVGFNSLSNTPLTHIDTVGLAKGFYGFFMTNSTGNVFYKNIPSTTFVMNIIAPGMTRTEVDNVFTETLFAYYDFSEQEGEDMRTPISYTQSYADSVATGGFYRYNISFSQALVQDKTIIIRLEYNPEAGVSYIFENEYFAGSSADSIPVKGIYDSPLSYKMRLQKAGDHLIMYAGNSMVWSDFGNFGYFPGPNYKVFPIDSDDEITAINYFRGSYIVFTRKTIWKLSGNLSDITNLSFTALSDSIGCIAPDSVRSFENTIVFMSTDGLYRIKQAYYTDGLENVEKIDKHIKSLIVNDETAEGIIYNEQYMLFTDKSEDYDVARYYYTIDIPNGHPFVVDKYGGYILEENGSKTYDDAYRPDAIFKLGFRLFSVKNYRFYQYDIGYTDFLPPGTLDEGNGTERYLIKLADTGNIHTIYKSLNGVITYFNEAVTYVEGMTTVPGIYYYHEYLSLLYLKDTYFNFLTLYDLAIDTNNNGIPLEQDTNTAEEILKASYETTIVTSNNSFGYPTHTKKMKSLYIKTDAKEAIPFYISISLDNETDETLTTEDWIPVLDPTTGEIHYVEIDTPNLSLIGQTMKPTAILDYFILNQDQLNSNTPTQLVKLPFSGKGRNVKIMIRQKKAAYFSIENIGFSFKLGKVRENRR